MLTRRFGVLIFSVAMLVLVADGVSGQTYPNKPIRIFTGGIGSGADITARMIAQGISSPLGQPVIVENRGGTLPELTVSKATSDGYSLLLAGSSIILGPLFEPMEYDAVRDFSPVTMTGRNPNILIVHPSLPVKSVKELIALAKAKPGELNYGSSSPGSSTHLAGELFKSMAGVNIYQISFKGGAPALIGLMVGEVQMVISSTGSGMPHVKLGKVRALAVTSLEPSALAPGLPTVAASGLPGYEFIGFDSIFAPAKTPIAIINQLNREMVRFLNTTEAKEKFLSTGVEVVASSQEELGNKMKSEIAKWGKLMREIGVIKTK